MTNLDKFKEVFGFIPTIHDDTITCIGVDKVCDEQYRKNRPYVGCSDCPFYNWWEKEYIPCFEMLEELQ